MRCLCWSSSTNQQFSEAAERIAHLEQLVGQLTVRGIRHGKKGFLGLVEMTLSEKRSLILALQQEYSVQEICQTLSFNRSSFYYHPREDPSEDLLRSEIEKLVSDGIRDTGIGVSGSCHYVWDTPLVPDASLGSRFLQGF